MASASSTRRTVRRRSRMHGSPFIRATSTVIRSNFSILVSPIRDWSDRLRWVLVTEYHRNRGLSEDIRTSRRKHQPSGRYPRATVEFMSSFGVPIALDRGTGHGNSARPYDIRAPLGSERMGAAHRSRYAARCTARSRVIFELPQCAKSWDCSNPQDTDFGFRYEF